MIPQKSTDQFPTTNPGNPEGPIGSGGSYEYLSQLCNTVHYYPALEDNGVLDHKKTMELINKAGELDLMLRDFLGNKLSDLAYHAAVLFPAVQEESQSLAEPIINLCRQTNSPEDAKYIAGLLLDNKVIDRFTTLHSTQESETAEFSTTGYHWIERHDAPIDPQEWVSLHEEIDTAAIAIKSAGMLLKLDESSPPSEELFRDISIAERLYAPMCELNGLDGLAMEIMGRANILRLKHSGNYAYVERARKMLDEKLFVDQQASPHEHAKEIMTMIGFENLNEPAVSQTSPHETVIGHGELEYKHDNQMHRARYVYRGKSAGSLAMKMFKDDIDYPERDNDPMDILAYTIIIKDQDEIGPVALRISHNIKTDPNLIFKNSPSKRHAISVSGDQDYVDDVFRQAPDWNDQFVDVKEPSPALLRVTKVTFLRSLTVGDGEVFIPCEIQILTEQERGRARTGDIAHILYKLRDLYGASFTDEQLIEFEKYLEKIHSERFSMSINQLSDKSSERVEKYFNKNPVWFGKVALTGARPAAQD